MIRVPFNILGTEYKIRPYTTKDEKEVLLLKQLQEDNLDYCLDEVLRLFSFEEDNDIKISELSKNEKIIILYLYRSISVGDNASTILSCNSCKETSTHKIKFDFHENIDEYYGLKIPNEQPNSDNLDNCLSESYKEELNIEHQDDLDLDEFEEILKNAIKFWESFNFKKIIKCPYCSTEQYQDCSRLEFALDHISEGELMQIYTDISVMLDQGLTKTDIDGMISFERAVFLEKLRELQEYKNSIQGQ